ncbi:hypothetical protein [Priestia megaterium]|uniref:hypothetical protein n=1 Tax=Priestia megaterium TaxID=1404 RepID=UPI00345B4B93
MGNLSTEAINVILPVSIVLLTLLIKLIVNHNFTWIGFGKEMIMLPGDISILSISLITSAILVISNHNEENKLLINACLFLVIFFGVALAAFALSKKAMDIYCLDNKGAGDRFALFGLFVSSYGISIIVIYIAIIFLLTGVKLDV